MKKLLFAVLTAITITSCTNVDSGHTGAGITWGGKSPYGQNNVFGSDATNLIKNLK